MMHLRSQMLLIAILYIISRLVGEALSGGTLRRYLNIGFKLCKERCVIRSACQAVDYDFQQLTCDLLRFNSAQDHLVQGKRILRKDINQLKSISWRSLLDCAASSLCLMIPNRPGHKIKYHCVEEGPNILRGNVQRAILDFVTNSVPGYKRCPDHYTLINELNFCFKLYSETNDTTTWNEAEKICQTETVGGRLVILDSQNKHQAVVESLTAKRTVLDHFVGASRNSCHGEFHWTDGQLVDQIPWCREEPRRELCGSLWAAYVFCMDDLPCGYTEGFICEKPMD